jgi:cyanophycinase-like exopeptidase
VSFPRVDRHDPRSDREAAARIVDAGAVFLGGGDQVKLVATLSGTRTCAAINALYQRGGVVCGASTGAAALTTLTMAGSEIDEEATSSISTSARGSVCSATRR